MASYRRFPDPFALLPPRIYYRGGCFLSRRFIKEHAAPSLPPFPRSPRSPRTPLALRRHRRRPVRARRTVTDSRVRKPRLIRFLGTAVPCFESRKKKKKEKETPSVGAGSCWITSPKTTLFSPTFRVKVCVRSPSEKFHRAETFSFSLLSQRNCHLTYINRAVGRDVVNSRERGTANVKNSQLRYRRCLLSKMRKNRETKAEGGG